MSGTVDMEAALLGAAIAGHASIATLATDVGLRPGHFATPGNAETWAAVVALHDRGMTPEPALVLNELGWGDDDPRRKRLYGYVAVGALPGTQREYAGRIMEAADLRQAAAAAKEIAQVAEAGEPDARQQIVKLAEAILPGPAAVQRRTVDEIADDLFDHAQSVPERVMSWPWQEIDELIGGFELGELTLVGGVTGHGKSVLVDQIVEHLAAKYAATSCLYLTEMLERTRAMRAIARLGAIPYERVRRGARRGGLTDTDMRHYVKALERWRNLNIQMEMVAGRTADDLAREIRRRRWTVCVIDLLNGLPGEGSDLRQQVEHNVKVLASCAAESGTHILAVNHLSPKQRMGESDYPREPVLTDFRESTQLGDLTHNALLVYLKPEEFTDGDGRIAHRKSNDAVLKVEKAKEGETGRLNLRADFRHMRFVLPPAPGSVGSAAPSIADAEIPL